MEIVFFEFISCEEYNVFECNLVFGFLIEIGCMNVDGYLLIFKFVNYKFNFFN